MEKWMSWLKDILVLSVVASIVLGIVGLIYTSVVAMNETWGSIAGVVFAVVLFYFAMKFNPGKEEFFEYFPKVLIVSAVVGVIGQIWLNSPFTFVLDFTYVGLALGFASVFFASGLTQKILK